MKIIVVDDEKLIRNTIGKFLASLGHEVSLASCGEVLLDELSGDRPWDLVITDLNMPGLSGLDLIRAANRSRPEVPIIAMTGRSLGDLPWGEMPAGVYAFLGKPFQLDELEALLVRFSEGAT